MALTQYTADTDIIETLGTNPEDRPTLTDNTFKAKFDENAANIKAYLNSLIAELLSTSTGKGASQIGIEDSSARFTATQVEAALAEIAGSGRTTETVKGLADSIGTQATNLNSHTSSTSNPHSTTASQVGAVSTAGGTITGALNFNSSAPEIRFTEADTSKIWVTVCDASNYTIREDGYANIRFAILPGGELQASGYHVPVCKVGTALPATTGTMTATMDGTHKTITPTGACTFNASGGYAGQTCAFVITTSGTTAYTLTWGTNFKTTGALSTGTVTAKMFAVSFIYDGTNWVETARTTAM